MGLFLIRKKVSDREIPVYRIARVPVGHTSVGVDTRHPVLPLEPIIKIFTMIDVRQ